MAKLERLSLVAGAACALALLSTIPGERRRAVFCCCKWRRCWELRVCGDALSNLWLCNFANTAGGEIKALTPGPYNSALTIAKSITLTGVPGALFIRNAAGAAITIQAGAGGVVTISNLTINGMTTSTTGINVLSAAQVTIKDCVIKNFVREGINFRPTVAVKYAIDDTLFAANNAAGVRLAPTTGSTQGALHRVTITGGGSISIGVIVSSKSEVRISDSLLSNHGDYGVYVQGDSTNKIWLSGNTITQNGTGFEAVTSPGFVPTAESAGNNFIAGNTTDVATGAGTLPLDNVGPQ